jgi:hypothetical protein
VLIKLGAVKAIDNQNPKNREALKRSFFIVAVGMNPKIINPFNSEVIPLLENWEWINEVVDGLINETN